jgi:hypothetical protein
MKQEALREIAQAGKEHDPGWYRVHRNLSIHVTEAALKSGATADDASYAMIVAGFLGALLVAMTNPIENALGFGLLYVGFLLDKVDGELARVLHAESARGIYLDRLYHRLIEPLLFVAVALHEFQLNPVPGVLIAGFVTALAANAIEENQQLAPFILWKRIREGGRLPKGRAPSRSRALASLTAALRPLKGFRMLIIMLPVFALGYMAEGLSGGAFPAILLYLAAFSLVVYLAVQSSFYLGGQMDAEIHTITQTLRGLDLAQPKPVDDRAWMTGWSSRPKVTPRVQPRRRRHRPRKPKSKIAPVDESGPQGEIPCIPIASGPNR